MGALALAGAFEITNFEQAERAAEKIANTAMAGPYKNKPDDVLAVMWWGSTIGLNPFESCQSIALINGKPSLWGDVIPALLWSNGFRLNEWMEGEGDEVAAFCQITRPNGDQLDAVKFSVAMAKRANLWGKSGPWMQYPQRMLKMRARSWAARDGASDALRGLYVAEEAEDMQVLPPRAPVALQEVPRSAEVELPPVVDAKIEEKPKPKAGELSEKDARLIEGRILLDLADAKDENARRAIVALYAKEIADLKLGNARVYGDVVAAFELPGLFDDAETVGARIEESAA